MDSQLYCPYCAQVISSIVGQSEVNTDKDIVAVCANCTELVILQNSSLRKLSSVEAKALQNDVTIKAIKIYAAVLREHRSALYN